MSVRRIEALEGGHAVPLVPEAPADPPGPERSLSYRDQSDCIVLSIEPRYFQRALEDSPRSERIELIDGFALQDPQLERLIRTLYAETRAGAPTGTLFGQSIAATRQFHAEETSLPRGEAAGSGKGRSVE